MFISLVIPVWNDEQFLEELLDSCLDQGLSPEEYEIICVDDGSTDRTPEILRAYAERHPNLKVITKQHGPAFGGGRTIGLDAAKGEFIWYVDHDDVLAPHALDDLKRIADENPDYDRIAFPYYRFNTRFTEEERRMIREGTLQKCLGRTGNDYYVWSSIMRRSFLLEHGIRPFSGKIKEAGIFWGIIPFPIWGSDWAMMNDVYDAHARSLQMTGRPLYHYRIHAGQSISDADPEKRKSRELRRRDRILFQGYCAWLSKQQYHRLSETDPAASKEALADTIMRLRQLVGYAGSLVP